MARYRIKWAIVEVCDGYRCWRDLRCIAQRRVSILGLSFWWPVDGGWREAEAKAEQDIERDMDLRAPLPDVREVALRSHFAAPLVKVRR